ncbi:PLATZ transcription factor family protein [Abeliophyllum distichum]|uniref:PLATZ transcription factor family protein n=1 Tax=Abeliophyllum distichum TaxID=126358 RepID=A0ABD1Q8E5_9LAMI
MVRFTAIPQWLQVMLSEKFFNSCLVHESDKKNEENTFCLNCCISLCLHCLPSHRSHHLLQIRRYVYQDVLLLKDAEKLMDCSFIQSYTTNSAKVVFLKQRPTTRQLKGSGNFCVICDRNLKDPYLFCSISCKVHHLVNIFPVSLGALTGSSSSGAVNCKAPMQFVKRKRTNNTMITRTRDRLLHPWPSQMSFVINRRKGVPRRSPLC